MVSKAVKAHFDTQNTPVPQIKQADPAQEPNNAGGFSFVVSDKSRLERFLMLGSDGGTYYVNEKKLTEQNIDFLIKLIRIDPELVLNTTVEVSHSGRAFHNSAAVFVMALLFKHASTAFKAQGFLHNHLKDVARTSTHLFEFATYVELLGQGSFDENMKNPAYAAGMARVAEGKPFKSSSTGGGWGGAKRRAVANWYTSKTSDQLAYQAVKYRQRDGWTHRDLFRLSHPKGVDQQVANFILGKPEYLLSSDPNPLTLRGFTKAQGATTVPELIQVLDDHKNLPWEAVPTQFHKEPELWKKLFANGQLQGQALLRQITRLAKLGMFKDMVFAREYADRLIDAEMIAKNRVHPIQYLLALVGHTEGQIQRSKTGERFNPYAVRYGSRERNWDVSPIIRDALNLGFHAAFQSVEPANKRTFIALDVSSSMSSMAVGIDLSCAQVGAAMAMTVARTEPFYDLRGFTAGSSGRGLNRFSGKNELTELGISATTELSDAMRKVHKQNFGSTDCSLPMEYALSNSLSIDTFVVITDNETYAGKRHPHVALREYRKYSGIDAKLVVMGMTATKFTIADQNDRGMLDVVGCDTSVPRLISEFSAGRV